MMAEKRNGQLDGDRRAGRIQMLHCDEQQAEISCPKQQRQQGNKTHLASRPGGEWNHDRGDQNEPKAEQKKRRYFVDTRLHHNEIDAPTQHRNKGETCITWRQGSTFCKQWQQRRGIRSAQ